MPLTSIEGLKWNIYKDAKSKQYLHDGKTTVWCHQVLPKVPWHHTEILARQTLHIACSANACWDQDREGLHQRSRGHRQIRHTEETPLVYFELSYRLVFGGGKRTSTAHMFTCCSLQSWGLLNSSLSLPMAYILDSPVHVCEYQRLASLDEPFMLILCCVPGHRYATLWWFDTHVTVKTASTNISIQKFPQYQLCGCPSSLASKASSHNMFNELMSDQRCVQCLHGYCTRCLPVKPPKINWNNLWLLLIWSNQKS